MNVNMERVEENKMQQYREETVKLNQILSSFQSIVKAFLSLSRSPEPFCWSQKQDYSNLKVNPKLHYTLK